MKMNKSVSQPDKCYQIICKGMSINGWPGTLKSKSIFLNYPTEEQIEAFKKRCLDQETGEFEVLEAIERCWVQEYELVR